MNARKYLSPICFLAFAALAQPAAASVVGGAVTGGYSFSNGGVFVELTVPFPVGTSSPENTVGDNNFQNLNLYAFDEDQNILLTQAVAFDIDAGGNAGSIAAGSTVASHYVAYDPAGTLARTQIGYIDFDSAIYGVATSSNNLDNSDFLANTGVTYEQPNLRGLENNDSVWIDPTDNKRLWVDWQAGSPGDYVRVFTDFSPGAVSAPATLGLFGLGLVALGIAVRRRR